MSKGKHTKFNASTIMVIKKGGTIVDVEGGAVWYKLDAHIEGEKVINKKSSSKFADVLKKMNNG